MSSNITKCTGLDCPIKDTCKRFVKEKDNNYSSYLSNAPFDHKNNRCVHHVDTLTTLISKERKFG